MTDERRQGAALRRKAAGILVVLAIGAFFAVMWGLMLRAHLPLGGRTQLAPNYDSLLRPDERERTATWDIYLGPLRIGKSVMTARREEDGTIRIQTASDIALAQSAKYVVGVTGNLDVQFEATVSPLRGPTFFQASSKLLDMDVVGLIEQDGIHLRGHVGGEHVQTTLPYSPGGLLGEALSPLAALPELKQSEVGKSWIIDVMNPIAGRLEKVTVRIARSREVVLGGKTVRVFQLAFATGTSRWDSWVTERGEVLVQGTPFGLTIQREDISPEVVNELRRESEPASGATQ